ncbi:MAG: PhoU domain-containing protein [Nanobdellota archaeon]
MEIRKVQKTGDMHYIYLPTNWCKKHNINSKAKLSLDENSSGALLLYPHETKEKERKLELKIDEEDQDVINKLIMACYINPLSSFKIHLKKEMDVSKLLNQKNIMGLESVEIDKKAISSDSTVSLSDPDLLLKTMVKKVKNLVLMMDSNYNEELIRRYEEEIDRNKILIEKSIIGYMTLSSPAKLKMIDLFYISQITRDLERMVDHLIKLKKEDLGFIKQVGEVIQKLKEDIEAVDIKKKEDKLEYNDSILFLKKVKKLKHKEKEYNKRRIKSLLLNISEVLLDWSITNTIREK